MMDSFSERWRTYQEMSDQRSNGFRRLLESPKGFRAFAHELGQLPLLYCPHPSTGSTAGGCGGQSLEQLLNTWNTPLASERQLNLAVGQVWTDVRIKSVIELRAIDCPSPHLIMAAPALWVGLLYDDDARAECLRIVNLEGPALRQLGSDCARYGLQGTSPGGRPIRSMVKELVEQAAAGLKRRRQMDAWGHDETVFLEPLAPLLREGVSQAEVAVSIWGSLLSKSTIAEFLERSAFRAQPFLSERTKPTRQSSFDLEMAQFGPEATLSEIQASEHSGNFHAVSILDPGDELIKELTVRGYHLKPTRVGYEIALPRAEAGRSVEDAYLSVLSASGRRKLRKAYRNISSRMNAGDVDFSWHQGRDVALFDEFVSLHSVAMASVHQGEPLLERAVGPMRRNPGRWLGQDKTVLYAQGSQGLIGGAVIRDEGNRLSIMYTAVSAEEKERNGADVQSYMTWLVAERCYAEGRSHVGYGSDPNLYGFKMGLGLLRFKSAMGFRPKGRPRFELFKILNFAPFQGPVVFFKNDSEGGLKGVVFGPRIPKSPGLIDWSQALTSSNPFRSSGKWSHEGPPKDLVGRPLDEPYRFSGCVFERKG